MKTSKALVSQALSTLKENIHRTGDPLGFTRDYWSGWTKGLNLPMGGETILFTGRMYQMLPYVIQTTAMVPTVKPLLEFPGAAPLMRMGNRLAGEPIIRMKARGEKDIRNRGQAALKGVVKALARVGVTPGYLHGQEPYSGVLLHDLGLTHEVEAHAQKVWEVFLRHNIKQIITMDPHTTFMLRKVMPDLVPGFDIKVIHYAQLLMERGMEKIDLSSRGLPDAFVIHDSCVMTRDLELIQPLRTLVGFTGKDLIEPANNKKDTACCGGPVEYAFGDLCHRISRIRMEELAASGRNIITACPICLINLRPYEQEMGVRIWDMGEILCKSLESA